MGVVDGLLAKLLASLLILGGIPDIYRIAVAWRADPSRAGPKGVVDSAGVTRNDIST